MLSPLYYSKHTILHKVIGSCIHTKDINGYYFLTRANCPKMDLPGWSENDDAGPTILVDEGREGRDSSSSLLGSNFHSKVRLESSGSEDEYGFRRIHDGLEEEDEDDDRPPLIVHAESATIAFVDDDSDPGINNNVMDKDLEDVEDDDDDDDEEEVEQACQRYFLEKSGPKCFNCGEAGHMSRDCQAANTMPCFLCGRMGHQRSTCPEEICHNCWRPGHMFRECKLPKRRRMTAADKCTRCLGPGHMARECSLLWRQYVFARSIGGAMERQETLLPACYNCAGLDHWGDECPYQRKRADWTIFRQLDPEYLRMTRIETDAKPEIIRNAQSQAAVRRLTTASGKKQEASANWRKLQAGKVTIANDHFKKTKQQPVAIDESNYYEHFDGSYGGPGAAAAGGGAKKKKASSPVKRKHQTTPSKNKRQASPSSNGKPSGGSSKKKSSGPAYKGSYCKP